MEDLSSEPPTDINPYEVLEIETTATSDEVKTAYKKLALRHHPDKAQPHARDIAHTKFQKIAFAYAILSDVRRRRRYDTTGNTSESLELDDDDFNWTDFFRAQWADAVTGSTLNNFKSTYQNSEEERLDVLAAYKSSRGDVDAVFRQVMLSNPLDDEERFRRYIDEAIEAAEVDKYDAYINERAGKKKSRHQQAAREVKEAKEHAKKIGVYDVLFGNGEAKTGKGKKGGNSCDGLGELIQQRQKARAGNFLDDLEAKYAGGKKRKGVEPPEELFQKNRQKKSRAAKIRMKDEDEQEIDLDVESPVEEDDYEEDGDKPVETVKSKGKNGTKARKRGKRGTARKT